MRKYFALLLALITQSARAEVAPILAEYRTDTGSLPPEYAWDTTVTIREDDTLTLKHHKGYETKGPGCKTRHARVADAALAAIRTAAAKSGLVDKPAHATETPMVGGGQTGGLVHVGGQKVELLSQPAPANLERVGAVLAAIAAAI